MEEQPADAKTSRRHRIEIKVSAEQKDLIARGAAASRQGISEFVRQAAENAARDAVVGKPGST